MFDSRSEHRPASPQRVHYDHLVRTQLVWAGRYRPILRASVECDRLHISVKCDIGQGVTRPEQYVLQLVGGDADLIHTSLFTARAARPSAPKVHP